MSAASVRRTGLVATGLLLLTVAAWVGIPDPLLARVVILCGGALLLWLSEALPPWVPTLLLVAGIPLALGRVGPQYRLGSVMGWAADPVLALFFGGFALGAAASRHAVGRSLREQRAAWPDRVSAGSPRRRR